MNKSLSLSIALLAITSFTSSSAMEKEKSDSAKMLHDLLKKNSLSKKELKLPDELVFCAQVALFAIENPICIERTTKTFDGTTHNVITRVMGKNTKKLIKKCTEIMLLWAEQQYDEF